MASEGTNVTVSVVERGQEDTTQDCSLSWEIKEEDNGGSIDYEPGKTFFVRLYSTSNIERLITFISTNRSGLGLVAEDAVDYIGIEEDVYITFTGSSSASLTYQYRSNFNYTIFGSIYNSLGESINPSFGINESSIVSSENCYGVIKVSYVTSYDLYAFSLPDYGTYLITAIGTCSSGSTSSTMTVECSKEEDDDEENAKSCGLNIEVNSEDNGGTSAYEVGKTYTARLYSGSDIDSPNVFNSLGTISLKSSGVTGVVGDFSSDDTDDKVYVSFTGGKTTSLPFPYGGGFSSKAVGGFYGVDGNKIGIPSFAISEDTLTANVKCFGILELEYTTSYDEYSFRANSIGQAILGASNVCGGERVTTSVTLTISSEGTDTGSSTSGSSTSQKVSITFVYKDFVTGEVISGAQVFVDGTKKGTTDDSGKITIEDLDANKTYNLRATKDGYLDTDSDSLSNDQFVISV